MASASNFGMSYCHNNVIAAHNACANKRTVKAELCSHVMPCKPSLALFKHCQTTQKGFTLTLQETRSIHDSMNIPKIEFIAYIYILQSKLFITSLVITEYSISDIDLLGTDLFPLKFPLYNRIFT